MKKIYYSPALEIIRIDMDSQLLNISIDFSDDPAGETAGDRYLDGIVDDEQ